MQLSQKNHRLVFGSDSHSGQLQIQYFPKSNYEFEFGSEKQRDETLTEFIESKITSNSTDPANPELLATVEEIKQYQIRLEQQILEQKELARKEKLRLEQEELARKEQQRLEQEELARKEQQRLEQEELARKEQLRLDEEKAAQAAQEKAILSKASFLL